MHSRPLIIWLLTCLAVASPRAALARQVGGGESNGIKSIDFANLAFPAKPVTGERRTFQLHNGRYRDPEDAGGRVTGVWLDLVDVEYADLTRDGNDDAIVVLDWVTGGSAMPTVVYVYAMRAGQPVMLWGFTTGDRADGGLRSVSAERGELVVEIFSPKGKTADCCPVAYVRTRYRWVRGAFRRVSRTGLLAL